MVYRPTGQEIVAESQFWDAGDYADPQWVERIYGQRYTVHRELVQTIGNFVQPGRWLDVGCGPWYLLRAAKDAGWGTFGVDLSSRAVALARGAGLDVMCGDFPNDAPEGVYDVISLVHTLEYVADQKLILGECQRRLRPGGVLVFQLKNFGFWRYAEIFFRDRTGVWCPQDIRSYSPKTATMLVGLCGFEYITVMPSQVPNRRALSAFFALMVRLGGPLLSPSITGLARSRQRMGPESPTESLRNRVSKGEVQ